MYMPVKLRGEDSAMPINGLDSDGGTTLAFVQPYDVFDCGGIEVPNMHGLELYGCDVISARQPAT